MIKEKRILSYFICWLLLGFIVCFIGLSNVSASEIIIPGSVQFYDNSGSSVSSVETFLENNSYYATFTTTENGYGGLITFQLNTVIQKDRIYTIFILGGAESNGGTTRPSSKKYIGIGSNISNANSSYINSTNPASYSASSGTTAETSRGVYYTFVANQTGPYISVPYTTQNTCSNCRQYFKGYTLEDLGSSENLSEDEVNNIINSQTAIIQNNINNMEQSIVDSNKETQDVIKDQFNSCKPGDNLLSSTTWITGYYINSNNETVESSSWKYSDYIDISDYEGNYIYKNSVTGSNPKTILYDENKNVIQVININNSTTYNLKQYNAKYIRVSTTLAGRPELYVEEICSNKLDEAENTRKGIWDTIKNLPNAFMDMLKGLFIPEDGYFKEWFDDLKLFFEEKLGFLLTAFTTVIDFVNRYLDLNPSEDIIINIPDINVPNFENHIIIKATTLNWSELLRSKEAFYTLWQLYLSFIDVYIILNFLNLCENKYNRIFGGDTTQYEYYTVEDSYNVDVNTGEVKGMRRNERKTTRKKVN